MTGKGMGVLRAFRRSVAGLGKSLGGRAAMDPEKLGDFTMTPRAVGISFLATCIGFVSAFVALALLQTDRLVHEPVLLRALEHERWSRRPETSWGGGRFWCRWPAR